MSRFESGQLPTNYACAICGNHNVKLWRPCHCAYPLICATCAEEHQVVKAYNERTIWEPMTHNGDIVTWVSAPTGKQILMDKWVVDEEGLIPSFTGSIGPKGKWEPMTDQLIVDISSLFISCPSGETILIPAIPDEANDMWGYAKVSQNMCNWWKELPTHK